MHYFSISFIIFCISLIGFGLGYFPSKIKLNQVKEDFVFLVCGAIFLGYTISHLLHTLAEKETLLLNLLLILGGAITMKILNHSLFKKQVCCSNGFVTTEWGLLSLASICLCSLNDGFFLYLSQSSLYSSLILWILIHKFMTSFLIARVIYSCKIHLNLQRTMGTLILIATPATYLLTHFLFKHSTQLSPFVSEHILSFSIGILLYVTFSGILPRLPRYYKQQKMQLLICNVIFAVTLISGLGH